MVYIFTLYIFKSETCETKCQVLIYIGLWVCCTSLSPKYIMSVSLIFRRNWTIQNETKRFCESQKDFVDALSNTLQLHQRLQC